MLFYFKTEIEYNNLRFLFFHDVMFKKRVPFYLMLLFACIFSCFKQLSASGGVEIDLVRIIQHPFIYFRRVLEKNCTEKERVIIARAIFFFCARSLPLYLQKIVYVCKCNPIGSLHEQLDFMKKTSLWHAGIYWLRPCLSFGQSKIFFPVLFVEFLLHLSSICLYDGGINVILGINFLLDLFFTFKIWKEDYWITNFLTLTLNNKFEFTK